MNTAIALCRYRAGPLAALLALSLPVLGGAQATRRVVLPTGTVIPVRLDQAISSKTASVGDRFSTTVRYGQDDGGLPEGARIEGVVSEVLSARNGRTGVLDLNFRRMVTRGGQSRTVSGSLMSLDAKSIKRSDTGRLTSSGDRGKDRLKWVGIGAGAGLLVGVLTKGNNLLDTLLGAGAGYAYNEFGTKPKPGDVNLKAGTEFGIRLDRQFAFDTNRTVDYASSDAYPPIDRDYDTRPAGDDSDSARYHRSQYDPSDYTGASGDIGMTVDDRDVDFGSAQPFTRGSQVLVPLGTVSRAAGFGYRWDATHRLVYARNNTLRMGIGNRVAVLNGERSTLGAAPEMRRGTLYVPLEFVGMATRGTTDWDAGSRTITLTTRRWR